MIQIDEQKLELLLDQLADKIAKRIKIPVPEVRNSTFLDVKQAAELLFLSVPTIYSKVSRRELPHMKQGKKLYFSEADLKNYINEGRVKTNRDLEIEVDEYLGEMGRRKF